VIRGRPGGLFQLFGGGAVRIILAFKSGLVLPFWYWIMQVFLEKRSLNGVVVVIVVVEITIRASPYLNDTALHNIYYNSVHQRQFFGYKMNQNRFWPQHCPGPRYGNMTLPQTSS